MSNLGLRIWVVVLFLVTSGLVLAGCGGYSEIFIKQPSGPGNAGIAPATVGARGD